MNLSDCSCMKIKTPAYVKLPAYMSLGINDNGELIVTVDDRKSSAKINENGELEVKGI